MQAIQIKCTNIEATEVTYATVVKQTENSKLICSTLKKSTSTYTSFCIASKKSNFMQTHTSPI